MFKNKEYQANSTMVFADRWRRLIAQVLDGVVFTLPNYLIYVFFKHEPLIGNLLFMGLVAIYYIAFLSGSWQATPGKWLMRIYVVTKEGGKPSVKRVTGRFFSSLIPQLPVFIPAYYILYLTPEELAEKVNSFNFQYIHELVFSFYALLAVMIGSALVMMLVWYVPAFFTKERKTIPDMMCATRVVKGRAVPTPKES